MSDYVRLRQVCLAVPELAPAEARLRALFGLAPGHRDPRVARYGLENAVLTVGPTFIELVSPTQPGTAAGRFLERRPPPVRGAYMAIFDCADLAAARARAEALGIRIVNARRYERYENLQLHPADVGATLVEIHHNVGGEDLLGHYDPAGGGWQGSIRDDRVRAIRGLTVQTPRILDFAERWSSLLARPLLHGARIELEHGVVRFEEAAEESVASIELEAADADAILETAQRLECAVEGRSFTAAGVRWRL